MNIHTYLGTDKPTIKSLMDYNTKFAPHWECLGTKLLQDKYIPKLAVIKLNHPIDVEKCCFEMFTYWLKVDIEASWNKLIYALKQIKQNALAEEINQDFVKGNISAYLVNMICNML